jgi:hypothetical protein
LPIFLLFFDHNGFSFPRLGGVRGQMALPLLSGVSNLLSYLLNVGLFLIVFLQSYVDVCKKLLSKK